MKIINPFRELKKHEWGIYLLSEAVVIASNLALGSIDAVTLISTVIGITALVFVAKGNVWGQVFTVIFSILYSVTSLKFSYYGEMITYAGMTMPIAILSIISWFKHPYKKGQNEVKIHRLSVLQKVLMIVLATAVTIGFYYVLRAFETPHLAVSTVSVATSFLASYLMLYRNSYYAVAYAANDIVLIILWILASIEDSSYLPMIFCFVMFFINDIYGFISWKLREKKQKEKQ